MKVIFNLQIIGMLETTSRKWRQKNILVSSVKNGLEINCSQLSLCTENRFFFSPGYEWKDAFRVWLRIGPLLQSL